MKREAGVCRSLRSTDPVRSADIGQAGRLEGATDRPTEPGGTVSQEQAAGIDRPTDRARRDRARGAPQPMPGLHFGSEFS